jgi:hypothetical protein
MYPRLTVASTSTAIFSRDLEMRATVCLEQNKTLAFKNDQKRKLTPVVSGVSFFTDMIMRQIP